MEVVLVIKQFALASLFNAKILNPGIQGAELTFISELFRSLSTCALGSSRFSHASPAWFTTIIYSIYNKFSKNIILKKKNMLESL